MNPYFKNKYKKYTKIYKNKIVTNANEHKKQVHKVITPYVDEQNICNVITDYLPYMTNNTKYSLKK